MVKIDKKIVGYSVVADKQQQEQPKPVEVPKIKLRSEELNGTTYKIKQPTQDHALYVTINDMDGKPFEIFLNSKDVEHYQWTSALTRVISAVFRKSDDVSFLADELKSIMDPQGKGYFKKGKYIPSLIAEVGEVLQKHITKEVETTGDFPAEATLCKKCNHKSVVTLDKCPTCLNCADSHCG